MMVCPTVANDDRKVIGMAETMSGVVVLRDAVKADAVVIPRIRAAAWRAGYPGLVEDAVLAQLDPVADTQGWLAGWDTSGESRRVAEVDGTVVGYAVPASTGPRTRTRRGRRDPATANCRPSTSTPRPGRWESVPR